MSDQVSQTNQSESGTASCSLSKTEEDKRINWAREKLVPHYRAGKLVENGFRATYDATEESLVTIARLIDKESACCASFTFELIYEPPYDEVQLLITGPEGTRELIKRGFVDQILRNTIAD